MQKPIIKPIETNYVDGTKKGIITDRYKLHWSNDFVKIGAEYRLVTLDMTPKEIEIFNMLIYKHLDYYGKLFNKDTGFPTTKKDVQEEFTLSTRRINEIFRVLTNKLIIAKFVAPNMSSYIVNPIIAAKNGYMSYGILNLFSDYHILSLDKKVNQIYDLSINPEKEYD